MKFSSIPRSKFKKKKSSLIPGEFIKKKSRIGSKEELDNYLEQPIKEKSFFVAPT